MTPAKKQLRISEKDFRIVDQKISLSSELNKFLVVAKSRGSAKRRQILRVAFFYSLKFSALIFLVWIAKLVFFHTFLVA